MKHNFLFILNNFNDVDQTSPLMFRLLELNINIVVLSLGTYQLENDPRISKLLEHPNFKVRHFRFYSFCMHHNNIATKILRIIFYNFFTAYFYLKNINLSACVYTWCSPISKRFQTQLFFAAKYLGVKNICLPHGQNIFLNYDVNGYLREHYAKYKSWPDFSPRNKFDLYIVQTKHHRDWNIDWGINPSVIHAWGSMRFSSSWVNTHKEFFPSYEGPSINHTDPLRVVFFVPHWHYNVDLASTMGLLRSIANMDDIVLAIKGHTRGDSVKSVKQAEFLDNLNVDGNTSASSSSLIDWSNIVINFGSSIGLEAIAAGKLVINPHFLHENRTVFDNSNAVYDAQNESDVIGLLLKAQQSKLDKPKSAATKSLLMSEIYADNLAVDPIDRYANKLISYISN